MQKLILKLDIEDDGNSKKKALKIVSSIPGLDSISMDMKEKKLTVIGEMDSVVVVKKLRKNFYTQILSVGPAKDPPKPAEPEKPAEPVVQVSEFVQVMQAYNNNSYNYPQYYPRYNDYARLQEENPNDCVIC